MRNMNAIKVLVLVISSMLMLVGIPAAGFDPIIFKSSTSTLDLQVTSTYKGQIFSTKTPTTPGYDAETRRLFVGSADRKAIDVFEINDKGELVKINAIDLTPYGGEPSGLDVKRGIIVVAVKNLDPTQPGKVVFFNTNGQLVADPIELKEVGKIAFTPNGRQVVVTIPGTPRYTPNYDYVDPEGAIAIIDLSLLNWRGCRHGSERCHLNPKINIADFKAYNHRKAELIAEGVRIYGPNNPTVAQDINPTSFAISKNSHTAWISLEGNNAMAVVDLEQDKIMDIIPLGRKNHNELGKGFSASDQETIIHIQPWPVYSFYSPNDIAVIESGPRSLLITTNRGDPKDFYHEDTYDYAAVGIFDGLWRQWWCGEALGLASGDHVLYSYASTLAGPWLNPEIAFGPSKDANRFDGWHTCDPSVIRVNGTYYMYYGAYPLDNSTLPKTTAIGVALGESPSEFYRPANPNPIIQTYDPKKATDNPDKPLGYGAGQPSAVYLDGWVYLFFSDSTAPASNPVNGGSLYCIRSRDPLFQGPVEELTASGFVQRSSTANLERKRSLYDAFSVDVQFIDNTQKFVLLVHNISKTSSFRFFDKDLNYKSTLDLDIGPPLYTVNWTEGGGFVRQENGHALPHASGSKNLMSLIWFFPTGSGGPSTWDVYYASIDIKLDN